MLDIWGLVRVSPCVWGCFRTERTAAGCRRQRLEGNWHTHTVTNHILTVLSSDIIGTFSRISTQTRWPTSGPDDHQMTETRPDYRRDPPELETDRPAAYLDKETGGQLLWTCSTLAHSRHYLAVTTGQYTQSHHFHVWLEGESRLRHANVLSTRSIIKFQILIQ